MKVIILCNGTSDVYRTATGTLKQLISIDGERILDRTLRQLIERGVTDITISTNNPLLMRPDVANLHSAQDAKYASAGHGTLPLWSTTENTLLLLGDVRYSDAAMDKILQPVERWTFYCRFGPIISGVVCGGEGWAVQLPPHEISRYAVAMNRIQRRRIIGTHFWQQYRVINGHDINDHKILRGHVIIDDETEDFDYPYDLEQWIAKYPEHRVDPD